MGITTVTTTQYECDVCRNGISEADAFHSDQIVIWSDRDVTTSVEIGLSLTIPYSQQPNICCRPCAATLLRRCADGLETKTAPE